MTAPAPALAITEEHRAEGLTTRIVEILDHPDMAPTSLPYYREAARLAFETAAASTEQPAGRP